MTLVEDLKALHGNPRNIYGQAKLFKHGATYYLVSYNTVVLTYSLKKGIKRTWGGYSRTTLAHINYFNAFMGLKHLSGSQWENLPVFDSKYRTYYDILSA